MLFLNRKLKERVIVGNDLIITLLNINPTTVRITVGKVGDKPQKIKLKYRVPVVVSGLILKLMSIEAESVRIGFSAPLDIPIHRAEVHERIKNGQRKHLN